MTQESQDLRSILDDGPLPIARAIRMARDIARELARAHLEGRVHGSLKPSSIVVSPSGAVQITGFGSDPVDHREDVYAFGALFYEMLTSLPPFAGNSKAPQPPSEMNPHVPRALDAVVLSMLAKEPAERMPGVPVLVRELERLEQGLGLASEKKAAAAAKAPPERREPEMRNPEHLKQIIDREVFDYERAMRERHSRPQRPAGSRVGVFASLLIVPVALGIGYAGYRYYSSGMSKPEITASALPVAEVTKEPVAAVGKWTKTPPSFTDERQLKPIPEPVPTPVASPAPAPVPAPAPSPVAMADPVLIPSAPNPFDPNSSKIAQPTPPPAPKKDIPRPMKAKAPVPRPPAMAQVSLAVSPHGEIYIDGEHQGATPPITNFELAPGMHRIEIRSAARKSFLTYVTVEPGDVRRIQHDFNAKPSRPPS